MKIETELKIEAFLLILFCLKHDIILSFVGFQNYYKADDYVNNV